ncbi:universal stress protein [Pleurocapsa sp. CCALA 161]|uniref:universal stress protein n=1 Tax=Pleurocapsa sp. CCALA 161 TaxID=2107688 RepID=UPI000D0573BF|nr:universal stress protein [Pleurocapsa sp. CCALA 161]PSB08928.1 universal stress protein [Pleurocapsa sp. CCALA 161]
MIDKILVAADYQANKLIFDSAISLAKATKADLMLLHVLGEDEPSFPIMLNYADHPVLSDYDYELYKKRYEDYKHRGIKFLQARAKEARLAGVNTEFIQLTGNPGREICQLASNWSADLILVGSRGLKGLKEIFLGSVSNYVTHNAPCSVLIVRNDSDSVSYSLDSFDQEEAQNVPESPQHGLMSNEPFFGS